MSHPRKELKVTLELQKSFSILVLSHPRKELKADAFWELIFNPQLPSHPRKELKEDKLDQGIIQLNTVASQKGIERC